MANMKIEVDNLNIRPCIIKDTEEKGLFHGWFQECNTKMTCMIPTGFQVGNMIKQEVVAIIEFEDGHVARVNPNNIRFLDSKFKEYCFWEAEGNE